LSRGATEKPRAGRKPALNHGWRARLTWTRIRPVKGKPTATAQLGHGWTLAVSRLPLGSWMWLAFDAAGSTLPAYSIGATAEDAMALAARWWSANGPAGLRGVRCNYLGASTVLLARTGGPTD
jgi:hypothetical protein